MAKAPGESRIPTFGSRIPIPGKFRFLPNLTLRTPSTNLKQDTNKTCIIDKPTPEIDRTITVSPAKSETMSPPMQRNCNKTILIQKTGSENSDPNCTVTLDANSAEATFVMKCIKRERSQSPAQSTASSGITAQDIGKRVCVGNAQSGKLKYVGEVRFNTGLWCGVELDDAVGKHDGCVKGVRYFTCSTDCGIMAPINKVILLLDNKPSSCDNTFNKVTVDDRGDSGPYSLLEVEDVRVNSNDALNCDEDELNKTLVLNGQVEQDLVTNINLVPALSVTNNRWSLISGNIISNDKNNVDMNKTYTPPLDSSFNCGGASTPMSERRREVKTKNHDSSSESTFSPNKLNVTVVKALDLNKTVNITPVHSPNDIPSLTKQNSFEFDESLGILTPDQMVDFSSFMKNTGSASSDDLKSILAKHNEKITSSSRTPSSENLGSVSKDGFKIPLASVPMSSKNSAIQDQKFSFDTVKLPSSEDLKSLICSNQNVLTLSSRTEILNTVDESLGILTSDQMVEFSTFVHNTGTVFSDDLKIILAKHNERLSLSSRKLPSSEDLKSLISNTNITTRTRRQNTFSRTPSSENLCSEVKFATNSFTCDSSKMCDESSLMILTPEQMEISVFDASKTSSSENLKSILCSHRSDKTISNSRTPSSENVGSLPHDACKQPLPVEPLEIKEESLSLSRPCSIDLKSSSDPIKSLKISASHQADISSPNAVENSMIDFSLGLLEEDMLATGNQFSSMIDTTTNLELPLDSISGDKIERFKSLSRSDQTPSPEDLPLDPIDPIKPVEMDIIEPNLLHPSSDSDPKTDVSKSTTTTKTNSFITSVTSITSLDTGYQGDGEMSRPASRGADHSPMAHKPNNPALVNLQWQRAIARRQDPMTDSDFFTESDADIHEDNAPRGDRRAQVIDGNLYGPNAQAPAAQDIFIGNQEEMDSSGIFTDLDMNRPDDFSDGERNRIEVIIVTEDKSPSEISTKSITENSQELKESEDLESTLVNETQDASIMEVTESISEKPKSPTQSITSNSSRKNVRTRTDQSKDENPSKKFKMPKRNVTSKVKTMMEQKQDIENQENRKPKPTRKPTGRWDAVMNKISQGKDETKSKIRLKEVKSKVSTGISGTPTTKREIQKTDTNTFTKPKIRRIRARGEALAATKTNTQASSSVHSSLSDLSISQLSNNNKPSISSASRVSKKRETVGRCTPPVTEVLTPGGHKPTPVTSSRTTTITSSRTRELKKSPPTAPIDRRAASRRPGATLPAKVPSATSVSSATRDQSRVTGVTPQKGGSPLRTQPLPEKTPAAVQAAHLLPHVKHSAKGVEALGVLVQYLVFNLDAFRTPSLKRELENIRTQWIKDKLELEETRMGYRRLEDAVSEQKILAAQTIEEERIKFRAEITELFEKQRRDIAELNERNKQELIELEQRLAEDNNELRNQLDLEISNRENEISIRIEAYVSEHRYRLLEVEKENERLRRNNQSAVEILREENEAIREQLDEKTSMIEDLKELKYINDKLKDEFTLKERKFEEKLIAAQDEIALLKEENKKILETFKSDTKDNKLQNGIGSPDKCSVVGQAALGRCTQLQDEVESLRTVLDLKLAELSELRRAHGELSQAAEELPAALIRAQSLQARVEDLELQLERKTDVELQLTKDNKRLQESLSQESKQNKRLTLHNEELQWKLKQNSEVVNAILQGQTPNRKSLHGSNQSLCDDLSYKTPTGSFMNRTHHTSSFNEKHHGTSHILERTLSFRERTSHFMKDTPNRIPESQSPTPNERFHNTFDLDDSPPSSPKVKGVVEKSDSVSWVLDMDESPEVIASRMVRRAGSFRNVTPPKSTPTKSPASKRPRTKVNNLSLSASAGAIVSPDDKNDNRYRSKSVSLRDSHSQSPEICHPGDYLSNSWHYSLRTSTPTKSGLETIRSTVKLENNPDLEHDSDVAISLPALPSEISRKKIKDNCSKPDSLPSLPSGDLLLLQSSFPKNSAGEAMISESNSEDECSSSTSERSPSASDTETSEDRTGGSGDKCMPKSKLQYDLFLLTESATNSEAMDCSWSEDLEV